MELIIKHCWYVGSKGQCMSLSNTKSCSMQSFPGWWRVSCRNRMKWQFLSFSRPKNWYKAFERRNNGVYWVWDRLIWESPQWGKRVRLGDQAWQSFSWCICGQSMWKILWDWYLGEITLLEYRSWHVFALLHYIIFRILACKDSKIIIRYNLFYLTIIHKR